MFVKWYIVNCYALVELRQPCKLCWILMVICIVIAVMLKHNLMSDIDNSYDFFTACQHLTFNYTCVYRWMLWNQCGCSKQICYCGAGSNLLPLVTVMFCHN